jgi:hypothetical protein
MRNLYCVYLLVSLVLFGACAKMIPAVPGTPGNNNTNENQPPIQPPPFEPPQIQNSVAELPRVWLDSNVPSLPSSKRTLLVGNGKSYSSCQSAVDAAQPGDEIVIDAGFVCGRFVLKNKGASTEWIHIRSSKTNLLPSQGNRVRKSDSGNMAIVETTTTEAAIDVQTSAHHYFITGLEIRTISSLVPKNFGLVSLGTFTEDTMSEFPHHIMLDRVWIHGAPNVECKRGVSMAGAYQSITDSIVDEIHVFGQDTQAVGGWTGPGPFKITNNELVASTENLMFGGDWTSMPDIIPSDIEIRKNYLHKPVAWKNDVTSNAGVTGKWTVKNLFELKNAKRVLVDGNLMENNWVHAQVGFAIVLTPRSEGDGSITSGEPWVRVQDVTFTNNIVRHSANGINILYQDNYNILAIAQNLHIENNLFYDIGSASWGGGGRLVQLSADDQGPVKIERNTFIKDPGLSSGAILMGENTSGDQLSFTDNLVLDEAYGVFQGGMSPGQVSLTAFGLSVSDFSGNVIAGQSANIYGAWGSVNTFIAPSALSFSSGYSPDINYHLLVHPAAGADISAIDAAFIKGN